MYAHKRARELNIDLIKLSEKERDEFVKKCRLEFNGIYGIGDETYTIGDFSMKCVNFHIDDEKIKNINENWYMAALDDTRNELDQAVEGMYHNLNSLQSRSGCQLNKVAA